MEENELSKNIQDLEKELNEKMLDYDNKLEKRYEEIYQEGGDMYTDEEYISISEERQNEISNLTKKIEKARAELETVKRERKEFEEDKEKRIANLEKDIAKRITELEENGEDIYLDTELTIKRLEIEKIKKEFFVSSREKAEKERIANEKLAKAKEISDAKQEYESLKMAEAELAEEISGMIPDKGEFSTFSEMKSKLIEQIAKLTPNGEIKAENLKDDAEFKKYINIMNKIEPEVLKEELKQCDDKIDNMKKSNVREDSPEFQEVLRDKLRITSEIETMQKKINEKLERLENIRARINELESKYGEYLISKVKTSRQSEPVAQKTVKKQPTAEQPTAEQPTEKQPTAEQPTAEQPTAEQPTAEQPTAEQPTAEQPTAEQPTAEQPTAEQPTAEQPTAEQPTAEQPAEKQPTAEQPTAEQPAEKQPTAEQPTAEQPAEKQPTVEQPTAEQPTAEQPAAGRDDDVDPKKFNYKVYGFGKVFYNSHRLKVEDLEDYLEEHELEDEMSNKGINQEVIDRLMDKGDSFIIAAILQDSELNESQKVDRLNAYNELFDSNKISEDIEILYNLSIAKKQYLIARLTGKTKITSEYIRKMTNSAYSARNFANIRAGLMTRMSFKIKDMIEKSKMLKLETGTQTKDSKNEEQKTSNVTTARERFAKSLVVPQTGEANRSGARITGRLRHTEQAPEQSSEQSPDGFDR